MKKIFAIFAFALMAIMANAQSCPDENHPHVIDLGLLSGTKWACCNVGANTPEDYGGYYAWGETEEKDVYNEVTYQYCTGVDNDGDGWYDYPNNAQYHDLGLDIVGTGYDVAHVKWGGSWVMPSREQQDELINNCTNEWMTVNGVYGDRCTSKTNGGSIFLPVAGYRWDGRFVGTGFHGYYWSSTQNPSHSRSAYNLDFSPYGAYWYDYFGRYDGQSVRPVISGTTDINLPVSSSDTVNQSIYNLYGIKVADNSTEMNTLPSGIYIVNGKKMVIK